MTEKQLEKLPNWGDECDCDEVEDTTIITHHGEWDEDFEYCNDCGGITNIEMG